jgi:fibronectin type 3 domain-containing protein
MRSFFKRGILALRKTECGEKAFALMMFTLFLNCGREGALPSAPDDSPPSIPAGLAVYRARDGEIDLVWNSNYESNLSGYKVYRTQVNPHGPYQFIAKTSYTAYADKGLDYDTMYYYRITASNTNGLESPPSDSVSAKPYNLYPPSMPDNLLARAHNIGDGISITLLWIPNDEGDLAGYKIYRSTIGNFVPDTATFLDTTSFVPYVDTIGVTTGVRYSYRVVAFDNGKLQSPASQLASDVVLDQSQLVSPLANATVTFQPTFQWRRVANANEYVVFVSAAKYSSEIWTQSINASADTLSTLMYTGSQLYLGRNYYWKVAAVTNDKQDPNSLSETRMFFIGAFVTRVSVLRSGILLSDE